jgi:hypothetical protein
LTIGNKREGKAFGGFCKNLFEHYIGHNFARYDTSFKKEKTSLSFSIFIEKSAFHNQIFPRCPQSRLYFFFFYSRAKNCDFGFISLFLSAILYMEKKNGWSFDSRDFLKIISLACQFSL